MPRTRKVIKKDEETKIELPTGDSSDHPISGAVQIPLFPNFSPTSLVTEKVVQDTFKAKRYLVVVTYEDIDGKQLIVNSHSEEFADLLRAETWKSKVQRDGLSFVAGNNAGLSYWFPPARIIRIDTYDNLYALGDA